MKLAIINFWDGAFEGDFFEYILAFSFGDYQRVTNPDEADIVFTSLFGNIPSDPEKTICYIGENVRPDFQRYKYSLSFDYDDYGGRNFRLPLWYSRIKWRGFNYTPRRLNAHNHGYEDLIPMEALTSRRDTPVGDREFCTMIANNPEGLRINLFQTFFKYKQVHGYGNMFGNPLQESKFKVLHNYKFCLCPENSIYPGYVTEKLLDAYAGGCIPIYSGHPNMDKEFNTSAFFNYQQYRSMDNLVTCVAEVDSVQELYDRMYCQPLLKEKPNISYALAFLHNTTINIKRK